jgi:uncharacterized Zn-binding protein involved in type VI secretion
MPAQTRLGDNDTGHDACPPRPLATGSPNVFINKKPAGRAQQDTYAAHGCPDHSPHSAIISSGSPNVFINKKPAGRIGDPVSCGSSVMEGSPNVFINDKGK